MKRVHYLLTSAAALLAVASVAQAKAPAAHAGAKPYVGHELATQAKVTIDQAQAIALKARPGKVTDRELEKEAGGSGLRYSFDIAAAGATWEVGVDARTGALLENAREGAHPD